MRRKILQKMSALTITTLIFGSFFVMASPPVKAASINVLEVKLNGVTMVDPNKIVVPAGGAEVYAEVKVEIQGSEWKATGWSIGTDNDCYNHDNHTVDGIYIETFYIYPPEDEGIYTLYIEASDSNNCTGGAGSFSYPNGVVVDGTGPTAPVLVAPENGEEFNYNPELSWQASTDELSSVEGYQVEVTRGEYFYCSANVEGTSFNTNNCGDGEGLPNGYYTYNWRVRAFDQVENSGDWSETRNFIKDTVNPYVELSNPETESSYENEPISINGVAYDEALTIKYVHLYYQQDQGEPQEIDTNSEKEGVQPLFNEEGDEPFEYEYSWIPLTNGLYNVGVRAEDKAGNWSEDESQNYITWAYDVMFEDNKPPVELVAVPAGGDFNENVNVILSAVDNLTGVQGIYYTTDGSEPTNGSTLYTAPLAITQSTTLKAIAYDNAGNASEVLIEHYAIAPVISQESISTTDIGQTSATIVWTTDDPSTSRVVYDTVAHPTLGEAPNYDYANSTTEDLTKVTNHSVPLTGLTAGTTYYFRTISAGSPQSVSGESSFNTTSAGGGGGGGGGAIAAPTACSSVEYGEWQACTNGMQYRNIKTLIPENCQATPAQLDAAKQVCGTVLGQKEGGEGTPPPTLTPPTQPGQGGQILGSKTYPDGSLLRGSDKKVWLIYKGSRFHIINLKELWKYRGREIHNVSDYIIAQYPIILKLK